MKKLLAAAMLALSLTASANTNQTYTPSADNIAARKHFQDSKFGIFLHWGLYAMLATGEWTMTNNNLNYKEYAKLAGGFYPSRFSAKEWCRKSRLRVQSIYASPLVTMRDSQCSRPNIPTITL